MFKDDEVYQIYEHIAAMCGHPDPSEGCRMIVNFCKQEMDKIASQPLNPTDAEGCRYCKTLAAGYGRHFCNKCGSLLRR